MLSKLMVESACRTTNILGNIFTVPFKVPIKTRVCQAIRPRWKFIVWLIFSLVVMPLQPIDNYYNIIVEASKISQGSANLTYLIFTLFCSAIGTFGFVLNSSLAVRMDVFQQGINQTLLVDQYFERKFFLLGSNFLNKAMTNAVQTEMFFSFQRN